MYAHATITLEEHPSALVLPATAVLTHADKKFCAVVKSGKIVRQPITLGMNDGTQVEVLSGLAGSEDVVKANAASLTEGQTVHVTPPAK